MRGNMLWFNARKDLGFIRTDEGERLAVHGAGFSRGHVPQGRCAQAEVTFDVDDKGDERQAENVVFTTEEAPRRARRRGRAGGRAL